MKRPARRDRTKKGLKKSRRRARNVRYMAKKKAKEDVAIS